MGLILHSYWRSTTSLRVRAALNLKGVAYQLRNVDLLAQEHSTAEFASISPGKAVPALQLAGGQVLTQSLAILDWLEDRYPTPPLLPVDALARARVRAAAQHIALDIHPVNNLKVQQYLKGPMKQSHTSVVEWVNHWICEGFHSFQRLIDHSSRFCFGEQPGLADLCLVGQMVNARRFDCDLNAFDRLCQIDDACRTIPAISLAIDAGKPTDNMTTEQGKICRS